MNAKHRTSSLRYRNCHHVTLKHVHFKSIRSLRSTNTKFNYCTLIVRFRILCEARRSMILQIHVLRWNFKTICTRKNSLKITRIIETEKFHHTSQPSSYQNFNPKKKCHFRTPCMHIIIQKMENSNIQDKCSPVLSARPRFSWNIYFVTISKSNFGTPSIKLLEKKKTSFVLKIFSFHCRTFSRRLSRRNWNYIFGHPV